MLRKVFMACLTCLLVALMTAVTPVRAADAVAGLPDVEQVTARIEGSDPFDTAARRYAAFERLGTIVRDLAGRRAFENKLTAEERRLTSAYGNEARRIQAGLIESLPPAERSGKDSQRAKWFQRAWGYEHSPDFNAQLAATFFSPDVRAAITQSQAAAARDAKQGRAMLEAASRPGTRAAPPADVPEWERLVPATWRWALNRWLWVVVFGGLAVFGIARTLAPSRLDSNAATFSVGGRNYALHRAAGTVTDLQRWGEARTTPTSHTVTHHDGSQSTVHGTTTRVTNRIQVMLREASGRTRDIQLADLELALAVGQRFAAFWAIAKGRAEGPYLFFHNYELARNQYLPALDQTLKPAAWPAWPLAVALFSAGLNVWAILAVFIAYWPARAIVQRQRVRHFKQSLAPKILAAQSTPDDVIVGPGGGTLSQA